MELGDVREVERLLRRVVREELSALLNSTREPLVDRSPLPTPEPELMGDRFRPYLLSDAELSQAESLLPEAERPILRKRVMAARLEKMGNRSGADKMRRQADGLAARLVAA